MLENGSVRKVPTSVLGQPSRIELDDGGALFEHLVWCGWLYQDEIRHWLFMERGIYCSQSTMARYLKEHNWTSGPYDLSTSIVMMTLRESYCRSLRRLAADDLVFLDESIFEEKFGWRHKAYTPIGDPGRCTQDIDATTSTRYCQLILFITISLSLASKQAASILRSLSRGSKSDYYQL